MLTSLKIVKDNIRKSHEGFLLPTAPALPKLIAVSKTHPVDKIEPLLKSGHRIFGENRVQEAYGKWAALKAKYNDIELHLIGTLQTNKVKEAVALFDIIQTIDRKKLANCLAKELQNTGKKIKLFIQINLGQEEQKSGIQPQDADEFIAYCKDDLQLPIIGLMCIPPENEDSAMYFALLKKIAARNNLAELSMGMSADYELASCLGATYIRVGSAIFGKRPPAGEQNAQT